MLIIMKNYYVSLSDADNFLGNTHSKLKAVKCNKALWKVLANIAQEQSATYEEMSANQKIRETGAEVRKDSSRGLLVGGSLTQVQDFELTLTTERMERTLNTASKGDQKGKILENFSAEIAPWVFLFCPGITSHMEDVKRVARVTVNQYENVDTVHGRTLDHLLKAESVLSSIAFRGTQPLKESVSQHNTASSRRSLEQIHTSSHLKHADKLRSRDTQPSPTPGTTDITTCLDELHYSMKTSEGIKVSIYLSDITQEKADVIVNAANDRLQHYGGVAQAISECGGPIIQRECTEFIRKRGPLTAGDVFDSSAGDLNCNFVLHAVGPICYASVNVARVAQELEETLLRVLEIAHQDNARSIAFPAISSGVYGMPVDLCARVFYNAVAIFSERHLSTRLQDIRIVINEEHAVGTFILEFFNAEEQRLVDDSLEATDDDLEAAAYPKRSSDLPSSGASSSSNGLRSSTQRQTPAPRPETFKKIETADSGGFNGVKSGNKSLTNDAPTGQKALPSQVSGSHQQAMSMQHVELASDVSSIASDLERKDTCDVCTNSGVSLMEMNCCKNPLCKKCFNRHFEQNGKCPFCTKVVCLKEGNQPKGEMNQRVEKDSHLPGFDGAGTIVIAYDFPDGVQTKPRLLNYIHSDPGETSPSRTALYRHL
ncbi:uncharacterized protein LOC144438081 [Glandiceps talaboti]